MNTFFLREEHFKLLAQANWQWQDCEFGAPKMDPKRPYGNSDVITDIAEILGDDGEMCPHCSQPLEELDDEKYRILHGELPVALQIIFNVSTLAPGEYRNVADEYATPQWKRIGNVE